ncbi:hypothetical protein SAMN04515620_102119 [Collimonas sp. OK607]|nr:hypothetical protein SAMN04515620_102119 [Collimonas sp. OK607]
MLFVTALSADAGRDRAMEQDLLSTALSQPLSTARQTAKRSMDTRKPSLHWTHISWPVSVPFDGIAGYGLIRIIEVLAWRLKTLEWPFWPR